MSRDRAAGFLMSAPAVVLFSTFMVLPVGLAFYLSLTDWNGFSADPPFVGLANYREPLGDRGFWRAVLVTVIVAGVGTVACNALGLGLALLVNVRTRSSAIFRALFFYPHVIGAVIIGFLWGAILGTNGAVNALLRSWELGTVPFLADPVLALASVVFVVVWSQFGVNVVLYLAGLQTIPAELLEAGRVDGAAGWQLFRHVTFPLLAPTVTINIVLVLVGLVRVYDVVFALTGGGPAGRTQTVAFLILAEAFENNRLGYGSAQAVVLMLVSAVLAIGVTTLRQGRDRAVQA